MEGNNKMIEKRDLREIRVKDIKIRDSFWSQKQELVTDVVIPYQEKILRDEIPGAEKSHAIENFRIAAGLAEGEFYGMVFQDSDVAKWLEGVAYSLAIKPDAELEGRADDIINMIAMAQQEDGYLNTYFTIREPEHRWQNLQECHELYCAGHMMEAAAAYYESTGKDKLLRVMERMAQHIAGRFGEDKERGVPGHQEVEIGLMKLYHVTGKEEYRELAKYFINERGKDPDYFIKEKKKRGWTHFPMDPEKREYSQCHKTVYDQTEAVGHSVRAVYMYTAMADLAASCQDERLYAACRRLWDNMVNKRMYLTGGIGSTVDGEAFTIDYDLPNDTAYAETCASIGTVFFAKRMLAIEADGHYADIMERELYNGILSGMQLDGKRFFYVNPLEVEPGVSGALHGFRHVLPQRPGWYACACCPPNVVRLLASLGSYAWDESGDTIYSHLFLGQEAKLEKAAILVESAYPWEGKVSYRVSPKTEKAFSLAIHIPGHLKSFSIWINGQQQEKPQVEKGYLYLHRKWLEKDKVEIEFPMEAHRVYANPKVRADAGCVAFMRGPVVYCFEGADNGGTLQALRISKEAEISELICQEGILKGQVLLEVDGVRLKVSEELYSDKPFEASPVRLRAVPYYTWGNRGENQMRVWMQEEASYGRKNYMAE